MDKIFQIINNIRNSRTIKNSVFSLNMDSYSLVFSVIFFISFMIFFYQKVGSNQLTEILSNIVTYGYTRYMSKNEITNIKNNLFTNSEDIFNEITYYIEKIGKLYDVYNYKILQNWYNFLNIFFILLILIIIFDINYAININSNNSKQIKNGILFIVFVIFIIYFLLKNNDNNNIKNDFNNLEIEIKNLREEINKSSQLKDDNKKNLNDILNILNDKYKDELNKSNESFTNYSKTICYEPSIETDMISTFSGFAILFIIIFIVYKSISYIVSKKNHKNLVLNFNSLLVVACILTVIEILYFLVIVMKTIKEKISEQTSDIIKQNIKFFDKVKLDSILNIFHINNIFKNNLDNNLDKNNLDDKLNNNDFLNNNLNNSFKNSNSNINNIIDNIKDIDNTSQNKNKMKMLDYINDFTNLLDKILLNSAINTEYNLKHENRRVLVVVIILLFSLLLFFYYNNNNTYIATKHITSPSELIIKYKNIIIENSSKFIPFLFIIFIVYLSFSKYNSIKLNNKISVNEIYEK